MGLDSVEIVLRVEEFFSISITDQEAETVVTVGDLYEIVCGKLSIVPLEHPATRLPLPTISSKIPGRFFGYHLQSLPPPKEVLPFTAQNVWDCMVAIFADQMGIEPEDIRYAARINQDLGID